MTQYGRKLLNYIRSNQVTRSTAQEVFVDPNSNFNDVDSVVKAINELADEGFISLNEDFGIGFEII